MKHNSLHFMIATGVSLILVGALVLFSDTIKEKRDVVFSDMNLALSGLQQEVIAEELEESNEELEEELVIEDSEIEEPQVEEEPKEEKKYEYEKYLGVLSIPKISFQKGFYSKTSNLNKVKFNLYVLPQSDYPDVTNGNLMIAGHSGNYNNSYFKNLYKLEVNDEVTVNYNNINYIYKIEKIYDIPKVGTMRVLRNSSRTTLSLVTCTKDDHDHQTVYIAYLDRTE